MASTESIQKLESRAAAAENLITVLKSELDELQKLTVSFQKSTAIENQMKYNELKKENENLKKEIESWKNRLIETEKKNSIQSVASPPPQRETKASSVPKEEVIAPEKVVDKKAKADKDKKEKVASSSPAEKKASTKPTAAAGDDQPVDVGRLDFKVGKIVSVKKHPDADSLYVEEVDVGEAKPRTVVSGLVKYVPIEEMQNRMVVLLCNLKPAKMRGVMSEAMVMCASTPEKVEPLSPPSGSNPGDLVHFDGYPRTPDSVLNPKKKIFETVAPDLKTDDSKVATYKGVPFVVPGKGPVTTASLTGVNIK